LIQVTRISFQFFLEKFYAESQKTPFEITQPQAAHARRVEASELERLSELRINEAATPRLPGMRFLRRTHRDSESGVSSCDLRDER
jgi:hypothetical protein